MKLQHSALSVLEAGTDEAGRGCLCGPVTAAAVILPPDFKNELLNDSKQLTEKQRNRLRPIIEQEALAWSVAHVSPQEIDEINILNASILAMHRSVDGMELVPEFIAVDGNRFKPYGEIPYHCQVKGDATYMNIAAASILAKTYRDERMRELAEEYPEYGWERNAGYPTKAHRAAIKAHGPTPHHRMSFQLLPRQLNLFDL
ncbi:MAG: ribonuclease HII [Schleiferiaceae bacterium]|nr:MAG: Ribonuclease HII [Cryomorphaceae bacterium]